MKYLVLFLFVALSQAALQYDPCKEKCRSYEQNIEQVRNLRIYMNYVGQFMCTTRNVHSEFSSHSFVLLTISCSQEILFAACEKGCDLFNKDILRPESAIFITTRRMKRSLNKPMETRLNAKPTKEIQKPGKDAPPEVEEADLPAKKVPQENLPAEEVAQEEFNDDLITVENVEEPMEFRQTDQEIHVGKHIPPAEVQGSGDVLPRLSLERDVLVNHQLENAGNKRLEGAKRQCRSGKFNPKYAVFLLGFV